MKRGYSIVEILIVIAIMGILAGGILTAYRFIAKENVTRHIVAKQESDVAVVINQLVKDIESAGFGIDSDTQASETTISSGNLQFPSLASREEQWSGCWAVVDQDGKLKIEFGEGNNKKEIQNYLLQKCELDAHHHFFMILDPVTRKSKYYSSDNPDVTQCSSSGNICDDEYKKSIAFYATQDKDCAIYPNNFIVYFFLNQTNLPKECAPGTYNLQKQIGTDSANCKTTQPVISCIFPNGFKVIAGIQSGGSIEYKGPEKNPEDFTPDNFKKYIENHNLKLFRICLIIQVGGRQDTPSTQPQFSNSNSSDEQTVPNCGGGPTIDATWWNNTGRWYRWKVIEQDIPLRNYQ